MKFKAKLTATRVKAYLEKPTGCPFCKSADTNEAECRPMRDVGGEVFVWITCRACKLSWNKIYTVTAVKAEQFCELCLNSIEIDSEVSRGVKSDYYHAQCFAKLLLTEES